MTRELLEKTLADHPAERFFLAIRKGDTPDNSQPCAIALGWCEEWLAEQSVQP